MSETIPARVQLRRSTLAQWTAANPVLLAGEAGYETDTGRLRIGDGATPFLSLPFASIGAGALNAALADYLDKATFDPQGVHGNAFARANHTGTQPASTITGLAAVATNGAYSSLSGLPALFGAGQSWQSMLASRDYDTPYQNTTARPIMVNVRKGNEAGGHVAQVAPGSTGFVAVAAMAQGAFSSVSFIVPAGHSYRVQAEGTPQAPTIWSELR